jgi:hypothetical protein
VIRANTGSQIQDFEVDIDQALIALTRAVRPLVISK